MAQEERTPAKIAEEIGADPFKRLLLLAMGDAVSLGLVSKERFEQEEIKDEFGNVIEMSGRELATTLIPLKLQKDALNDVLPYIYASRKPADVATDEKDSEKIVFQFPSNGREQACQ